MRVPLYQIDAFADAVFQGNPAAVRPLRDWLPDATLQAIAAENNLSETAFLIPDRETVDFDSKSGRLTVGRSDDGYTLDLSTVPTEPVAAAPDPVAVFCGSNPA